MRSGSVGMGPQPNVGSPVGSDSKESACNAGDSGWIPGSGKSPGEGNGDPLQHPCLENPMDRGTRQGVLHGVAKSRTQPGPNNNNNCPICVIG